MQVNAVVLAGRANDGKLRECADVPYEALLPLGGRPMLYWVVKALEEAQGVGQIVVVGPPEHLTGAVAGTGARVVPPGQDVLDNINIGLSSLPQDEKVLISTSDIPLITGPIVDDFLSDCDARGDADLYYAIVPKEYCEKSFPGVHRTYLTLKDGTYTGGNLFVLKPAVLAGRQELVRRLYDARKNPLQMVTIVGLPLLFGVLVHAYTVEDAEEIVSKRFGLVGRAVKTPHPEIGVDVDKPSDYELAQSLLGA